LKGGSGNKKKILGDPPQPPRAGRWKWNNEGDGISTVLYDELGCTRKGIVGGEN